MIAFALCILAALPFLPALRGGLVFDDAALLDMDFARGYGRLRSWRAFLLNPRELTHWTYALTWRIAGFSLPALHAFNLALHASCTLLLYVLLDRLGFGAARALLASAVFAVHPLQAATVCYISGRAVQLAVFFSLAAALHIHFALTVSSWHLGPAILAQMLAWKSKEDGALYWVLLWPIVVWRFSV